MVTGNVSTNDTLVCYIDTSHVVCSMVYVMVWCLSICQSQLLTTAAAWGRFAAVGQAGRRYLSITTWPAPSSNGATAAWWSAAEVSNVMFTAAIDVWTQTCCCHCYICDVFALCCSWNCTRGAGNSTSWPSCTLLQVATFLWFLRRNAVGASEAGTEMWR